MFLLLFPSINTVKTYLQSNDWTMYFTKDYPLSQFCACVDSGIVPMHDMLLYTLRNANQPSRVQMAMERLYKDSNKWIAQPQSLIVTSTKQQLLLLLPYIYIHDTFIHTLYVIIYIWMPCLHGELCHTCATRLQQDTSVCPSCRTAVQGALLLKTYSSPNV